MMRGSRRSGLVFALLAASMGMGQSFNLPRRIARLAPPAPPVGNKLHCDQERIRRARERRERRAQKRGENLLKSKSTNP